MNKLKENSYDCPSVLYKYLSSDRIDVLDKALIRYTPLDDFNDPFEGRPHITMLETAEQLDARLDDSILLESKQAYKHLPESFKKIIAFDYFYSLCVQNKDRAHNLLQKIASVMFNTLRKQLSQQLGALCLTELPDNKLMWSHYASSHTGYLIEFDTKHSYFFEQKSSVDEFRYLRKIVYKEERPNLAFSELGIIDAMFTKSLEWNYELEWRIFRSFNDSKQRINKEPYPIHLFSFPRDAVKSIILGVNITSNTEKSIKNILDYHPGYKEVILKKAKIDEEGFSINIV